LPRSGSGAPGGIVRRDLQVPYGVSACRTRRTIPTRPRDRRYPRPTPREDIIRSAAGLGLVASLALALTSLGTPGFTVAAAGPETQQAALVLVAAEPATTQSGGHSGGPSSEQSGPPSPVSKPRARTATVLLSGDLLWHDTVWASAAADRARTGRGGEFDFDPMFAALRPLVEGADLAVCHEEVPFAAPGAPYENYPVFAAPPAIASWIGSMGWDLCTTASNHSIDQGYDGLVRTADLLERAGVGHVGTFRTPAERGRPVIFTTDAGVRIGVVSGTFGLNGFALPADKQWAVSLWDARNLIAQAEAAKRAGADIVIVKYHGGTEYDARPSAAQVSLVRALTASPAVDLVVGEHAHVVQPITKVNGTWVVYGLGNVVGQSEVTRPRAYEGISVRFTFLESGRQSGRPSGRGWVVDAAEYVPTYWNHYGAGHPIRIQRVVRALRRGVGDRARLEEARREIRAAVDLLGHAPGLVER
jgi:Bacterial capsule synthesis protein PGA_cap